jgi:hypothetical protein
MLLSKLLERVRDGGGVRPVDGALGGIDWKVFKLGQFKELEKRGRYGCGGPNDSEVVDDGEPKGVLGKWWPKKRLNRQREGDGSEDVTLANTVAWFDNVIELTIWVVDEEIGWFRVGPVKEAECWIEDWLIEDRGGDDGATSVLEGSFEVSGDENRVLVKLKGGSCGVDGAVDSRRVESELNGREASREVTTLFEEVVGCETIEDFADCDWPNEVGRRTCVIWGGRVALGSGDETGG